MSTTDGTTGLGQSALKWPASGKRYWDVFREWRKRQRLRASLYELSDSELKDIGITRGEIDYLASHRAIDPRGIRSTSSDGPMFGTASAPFL